MYRFFFIPVFPFFLPARARARMVNRPVYRCRCTEGTQKISTPHVHRALPNFFPLFIFVRQAFVKLRDLRSREKSLTIRIWNKALTLAELRSRSIRARGATERRERIPNRAYEDWLSGIYLDIGQRPLALGCVARMSPPGLYSTTYYPLCQPISRSLSVSPPLRLSFLSPSPFLPFSSSLFWPVHCRPPLLDRQWLRMANLNKATSARRLARPRFRRSWCDDNSVNSVNPGAPPRMIFHAIRLRTSFEY